MKKLNFKSKNYQKGITLIALVITIIVLLILAGVTIAALSGDNGLLSKATQSRKSTDIAEEKEIIALAYNGVMAKTEGKGVDAEKLQEELNGNGYTNATAKDNGDGTITVTFAPPSNRAYIIHANGNIEGLIPGEVTPPPSGEIGNPDENGIFQETSTINGDKGTAVNPTIPKGFRPLATETSDWGDGSSAPNTEDLENGLVIQDIDGNEFVWIPAEVDEIAKLTSGTDSNGNPNYQGKIHDFTSTGATEKTGYGQGTTSYREPDTVSDYDGNATYLNIIKRILTGEENAKKYANITAFKNTMQEDYNAMIKSVETYHGFYVSRYEMSKSATSNTAASVANVTPILNDSNNMWYGLYAYGKTYNTSSVASSMMWGSQYDAMLIWMQNGKNKIDVTKPYR